MIPHMPAIGRDEALRLLGGGDLEVLLDRARQVRERAFGRDVELCAITNARSGRCPERCDYCVQSVHFDTDAPVFPMKDADTIAREAALARDAGARAFSVVTSGRRMRSGSDLETTIEAVRRVASLGLEPCASLGEVSPEVLARLADAGLARYHHNVETAPSFHPRIVHTHCWDDEVRVLEHARDAGLDICSGGILGMGESLEQRVEMAFALADLAPGSVSLNFLDPRPGTPLEHLDELTPEDCLRAVAVLRLVLPDAHLRICGGRAPNLGDRQADLFRAGATGLMTGGYLTTAGPAPDADLRLVEEAGWLAVRP